MSTPIGVARPAMQLALLVALAASLAGPVTATADEPRVTYHGQVLWISGPQLMIRDEDGWTFPVDLRSIDQAAYRGLRTGDWVTVVGVVSRSRSHVIAHTLRPDS
jgi:hypothetical protein